MPTQSISLAFPADNPDAPLHRRLAHYFRDAVIRRRWRPGEQLPPEHEIAEQFGVAVGTVRRALSGLVGDGILIRRQGKGTFVKRRSFDASLFRFWRFDEGLPDVEPPESRILQIFKTSPPPLVASRLNLKKHEHAVFISRRRLRGEHPIVAEEIWLSHRKFSNLLKISPKEFGALLYPLYEEFCGQYVASAEEQLSAEAAKTQRARAVGVKPGTTLIVISRLAKDVDGTPLEWRISWGNAALFNYRIEIH